MFWSIMEMQLNNNAKAIYLLKYFFFHKVSGFSVVCTTSNVFKQ